MRSGSNNFGIMTSTISNLVTGSRISFRQQCQNWSRLYELAAWHNISFHIRNILNTNFST